MAPGNLKVTVWRPAVVLLMQPCVCGGGRGNRQCALEV